MVEPKGLRVKWKWWSLAGIPAVWLICLAWNALFKNSSLALPNGYEVFAMVLSFVVFVVPMVVASVIEDKRIMAWMATLSVAELDALMVEQRLHFDYINLFWIVDARERARLRESQS